MDLGKVSQLNIQDRVINQLQSNIINRLNQILGLSILNGNYLPDVALASGDNTINHGLQRNLIGWMIYRKSAAVNIYDKQNTNDSPETTLILNSSGAVTVSIYVF